jgi:hypothetical protein
MVDRKGSVALHTKTPGFKRGAEKYFQQSLDEIAEKTSHWWLERPSPLPDFYPAISRFPEPTARCSGSSYRMRSMTAWQRK